MIDDKSTILLQTGHKEFPVGHVKKGASSAKRTRESSCVPPKQTVPVRAEQLEPDEEENEPEASDSRPDREVQVELQGSELWKRFYEIGTEMIITKAGRCTRGFTHFTSRFCSIPVSFYSLEGNAGR